MNLKIAAALVGALLLGGAAAYLYQQRQIDQLRIDKGQLVAEQERLKTDYAAAQAAQEANQKELEQLRSTATDLRRLRGESLQLRQQLDQAKQQAAQAAQARRTDAGKSASNYVPREKLAYAGYATPEDAMQTIIWAAITGTPEQVIDALSPELLTNTNAYREFEQSRQEARQFFKGSQVMAKKMIGTDRMEFKLQVDAEPPPNQPAQPPALLIVPLNKVATGGWKLGAGVHDYKDAWDQDGTAQSISH